jgi:hypothetical protein
MHTNKQLRQAIMRRVYLVYALRLMLRPMTLKLFALGAGSIGIVSLVSLSNVFANMAALGSAAGVSQFILYAVTHTEIPVQLSLAAIVLALIWLARDLARRVSSEPHPAFN